MCRHQRWKRARCRMYPAEPVAQVKLEPELRPAAVVQLPRAPAEWPQVWRRPALAIRLAAEGAASVALMRPPWRSVLVKALPIAWQRLAVAAQSEPLSESAQLFGPSPAFRPSERV